MGKNAPMPPFDYLNPGLPAGLRRVAMPIVAATEAALAGYGHLVNDPDDCRIEISVASPTLYVFLGVVQTLIKSPIPDEVVWCAIWLAIAIWQITGDGEARDYEGAALVALFVIVGAIAWFE